MKTLRVLFIIAVSGIIFTSACSKEYDNFNSKRILSYKHMKHGVESEYAGIILFEYKMDNYTKYQYSYLSCTCRDPSLNYQQLMYVEINNNNKSADEATIRNIEFQYWADSAENPENGITYNEIKNEFLVYLKYKSKAQIDRLFSRKGIKDAGQVMRNGKKIPFVDAYSGASVSVDNTFAALRALFKYHADKYYK